MVKSNELRLGNYIQDRGGKALRIDFMEHVQEGYDTKLGQLMHLEGQEVHPMTEYTDYANPIPLTEEWLLRLGFELEEGWYWKSSLRLFNIRGLYFRANFPIKADILYVHSLQNLYFALTGEELEIKDLDPQNVHKIS